VPIPNPVHSAIQKLTHYFEERQEIGEESVWLTPEARRKLKSLPHALHAIAEPKTETPAKSTPAAAAKKQASGPIDLKPEGATKAEKLAWLREQAKTWAPAKELDSLRDAMVFAAGNPDAEIVFIGDAPGAEEEKEHEPFVGPAGQLLTKIIGAMGLKRSDVYISNIVKFRPALPNQTNNNRKATAAEMSACLPLVLSEIEVIQPKVIVALGEIAAEGLLGLEGAVVGRLRSRFHDLLKIPVMVTYHPSYLLKNTNLGERRKVWEDLMLVMEKMGLPISDKQRGYFLK
jgi:uracil-DNA glycosylase family 4